MNTMRLTHFDWNKAKAFLITAETGSFSAASRILNVSQPTLGRQVAALEDELNVTLFERTSSGLMLTNTGIELLNHVRAMNEGAIKFSLTASGHSEIEQGIVSISATEATAAFILPTIIEKLKSIAPNIVVEIIATNESSDLTRREADIAIRAYRPNQADLIAKKIGTQTAHLYASPDYLKKLGRPTKPQDLNNADFLGFKQEHDFIAEFQKHNFDINKVNHPIFVDNHLVQWELVKQGLGIGFMTDIIGDQEIKVDRVLPQHTGFEFDVWLVVHRELNTTRRLRLVYDFLAKELKRL